MVVRYGLAGLGFGVAGVVVYRMLRNRGVKPESVARTAAHNLASGARKIATDAAPRSVRNGVKPLKKKHQLRSRVR